MANEIRAAGSLRFDKGGSNAAVVVDLLASMAGTAYHELVEPMAAGGNGTRILGLNNFFNGGWVLIINEDPTNYIQLATASLSTAGAIFAKLMPGEFALLRLDPTVTAPVVIANTATCNVRTLAIKL